MTINRSLILIITLACLTNCGVSSRQVVGTYVGRSVGDTIHIRPDQSYEYIERLNKGNLGWTDGTWKVKGHRIIFTCDHKPLVGYRLKVRPDSSVNDFQIKLLLADTDEPIYIEDVKIFKNKMTLDGDSFRKSKNTVKVLTNDFDSIVVRTFNFTAVKFPRTIGTEQGHIARIYPVERLYELDKVPFAVRKKTLTSTRTNEYENIFLSFKKIGD